ncbi:O-antigen ligase family protein [Desulfosporosinus youngiae]|uniref:Lipid A core-O-antigen ligase-like enyme n=1 Tax=Desulfosporosinus youngiae DSM 17734 TaxID=768710 RepID=H5XUD8_9FIRM|nr:O-antigen ligase family protein [Desulfosporosinus youngiae]EHQ89374.1 lipid A core-O-antigen ligase-like enyme [Desulfosporosinus youngiae DSM 17734]
MLDQNIELKRSCYRGEIYVEKLCVPALILYITSLFIFVDNPQFVNVSRVLFLFFAGVTTLVIISRQEVYVEKAMIYLYCFFVFCLASCFWALSYDDAVRKVVLLVQMLILLFLICQALSSKRQIDIVVFGIAIAGVALFIYGVIIYGLEHIYYAVLTGERLGKEISQENTMGRLASIASIVWFCYGVQKKNYLYFAAWLMPFVMVLASGSRTSAAIALIGILIAIIAKIGFKKSYKLLVRIPIVGVLLYFILQLSIFDSIKLRYFSLYSAVTTGEGDGNMRINMVKWGLEWFKESPIWGYGVGNYGELLVNKIGWDTYAHNNFIELLVGVGIIGFSLYYAVYAYIFYHLNQLMKRKDPTATILFIVLIMWICSEIGAVNYTSKMTYVLIGICISYIRLSNNQEITKHSRRKA